MPKVTVRQHHGELYYCKIKTDDWFDRLRRSDERLYQLEMKQENG